MKQAERKERLMPGGIPKYIRCYIDFTQKYADYITVVYTGRYRQWTGGEFWARGMNAYPLHPQGIGQMGFYPRQIDVNKSGWPPALGRKNHLGTRVLFTELPDDCKRLVLDDYMDLWDIDKSV